MVTRLLLIAGVASLLFASPALASTAIASPARPPASCRRYGTHRGDDRPPTTRSRRRSPPESRCSGLRFPDPTAATDILDYGVNDLWKKGIDGAGVTVAYVVTNPDPGLAAAVASYDAAMDLPPANITDLALPAPTNPSAACQIECVTSEDRLDAEAIHSMAPYANILFVHPPVPETLGMQGWPEVAQAIEMIVDQHLADVITVSMGDGESDFINDPTNPTAAQQAAIRSLDPAFLDAAAHNIPVLFASGDCGPTAATVLNDTGQCTPATGVTADHPADNPWATAAGGTIPNAAISPPRPGAPAPDALWTAASDDSDAASAGISTVYPQPWWQRGIPALRGVTGRASPDISMDASNGTSQASPTFAGILALGHASASAARRPCAPLTPR